MTNSSIKCYNEDKAKMLSKILRRDTRIYLKVKVRHKKCTKQTVWNPMMMISNLQN